MQPDKSYLPLRVCFLGNRNLNWKSAIHLSFISFLFQSLVFLRTHVHFKSIVLVMAMLVICFSLYGGMWSINLYCRVRFLYILGEVFALFHFLFSNRAGKGMV